MIRHKVLIYKLQLKPVAYLFSPDNEYQPKILFLVKVFKVYKVQ